MMISSAWSSHGIMVSISRFKLREFCWDDATSIFSLFLIRNSCIELRAAVLVKQQYDAYKHGSWIHKWCNTSLFLPHCWKLWKSGTLILTTLAIYNMSLSVSTTQRKVTRTWPILKQLRAHNTVHRAIEFNVTSNTVSCHAHHHMHARRCMLP